MEFALNLAIKFCHQDDSKEKIYLYQVSQKYGYA